ncbi:MAG: hypothetical protein JXR96_00385 [Deltaproteobacteria bacterium]|nr:hypothetical protein [Deltaproteobacteria bacterium]
MPTAKTLAWALLAVLLAAPASAAEAELPDFYLATNLSWAPGPLMMHTVGDRECGARLEDQFGLAIDFDYRLWYFFIGTHLGVAGNESLGLTEYAVRGGGFVPIGDHFSIVGSVWLGLSRWEDKGDPFAEHPSFRAAFGAQEHGLLLGASLGVRVMILRWFGLTADVSMSATFFDQQGIETADYEDESFQLNRFQGGCGVVFAW